MIYMSQMILSEPTIIIIWTYQDMMEWMSRILIGEMAGADEDFVSDKLGKCSDFAFACWDISRN
jgi:ATP-dependent RNA circularization protein (DNA/RNA ligase family)